MPSKPPHLKKPGRDVIEEKEVLQANSKDEAQPG